MIDLAGRRTGSGKPSRTFEARSTRSARSMTTGESKRKRRREPAANSGGRIENDRGADKKLPRPPEVDTARRRGSDFRLSDSEHVSPVRGRELSGIRTGRFSVVEEGYDWMLRHLNVPLSVSPVKTKKKTFKGSSVNPSSQEEDSQKTTAFRASLSGR